MTDPELLAALIEEAGKKSAVLWLSYAGSDRPRPAWHIWHEGAAVLVVDDGDDGTEQRLPGLASVDTATVMCRAKDGRDRLISWQADVHRIEPDSAEWEPAVKALRSARLNATDAARLPERWAGGGADGAVVLALRPTGDIPEHPGSMPSDEAAAVPPDTPATTRGRMPWVLGRRANRTRRLS